jgi:tRNA G18 (ribose-2'-O)-methylase SpoU
VKLFSTPFKTGHLPLPACPFAQESGYYAKANDGRTEPQIGGRIQAGFEKMPVIAVLENVRSAYNVGSVFRTADAFLIEAVYSAATRLSAA